MNGKTYVLQRSSDLQNWTDVIQITSSLPDGAILDSAISDLSAVDDFYRVRVVE